MRKHKIGLAIALTIAFLFLGSFTAPAKAVNWQPVTTITGTGSQTTSEFMVSGSEWRISWSFNPNNQYPDLTGFTFFVYRHGEDVQYLDRVIEYGDDKTSGILSLQGTGLHYITIETANTPGYTLTIEYDSESNPSDTSLAVIMALTLGIPIILIIIISIVIRKRVKSKKESMKNLPPPPPPA